MVQAVRPGDSIQYTFTIENGYQNETTLDFDMSDKLPPGFILDASSIAFAGDITNTPTVTINISGGRKVIQISNIVIPGSRTLPLGFKTGTIRMNVQVPVPYAPGPQENQATLTGFPAVFGSELLSDDDSSTMDKEITVVTILPVPTAKDDIALGNPPPRAP